MRNNTLIYLIEYSDEEERDYSYHWQTTEGELIERWDNAPHHSDIETFPYHKHIDDKIVRSSRITFEEVLSYIEGSIKFK